MPKMGTITGGGGVGGSVDTELAAAVALADNLANPTIPLVGAMSMVWDGTQWKRLLHNADGVDVDVTRVQGSVTVDSELPAAATLGDAMGSPSVPNVGALLALFDGTNYVRARGDTSNGLDVDVTRMPAAARTTDAIAAALQTDAIMNGATALTPKWAFANVSASTTDGSVVAAVTSKKIRPLAAAIMAGGTATNVTLNTKPAGAGSAKTCLFACPANGGLVMQFNPTGWFETASGEGLSMTTGTGSTVGILVAYVEV